MNESTRKAMTRHDQVQNLRSGIVVLLSTSNYVRNTATKEKLGLRLHENNT